MLIQQNLKCVIHIVMTLLSFGGHCRDFAFAEICKVVMKISAE